MSTSKAHAANNSDSANARPRLSQRDLRAAVLDKSIFDPTDPNVKHDILQTIIQYLQDEGYNGSAMVIQDEANVKAKNVASKRSQMRRMKRAILDGDWSEVERLLSRTTFRNLTAFQYAVHRQQYLELIEAQERQKAFSILQNRLRELESHAHTRDEFRDLCYLLTCKSVAEASSFRDWDGVAASRAALVEQYARLLEFDASKRDAPVASSARNGAASERQVPPGRLISLLQQALAFQIMSSRHAPIVTPRIGTLLDDYESVVIPNAPCRRYAAHEGNVKCVTFIGDEGGALVSGSSDNSCRIWDTASGRCRAVLNGHRSRIWDVSASPDGRLVASASGDSCIRIWDTTSIAENNNFAATVAEESALDHHHRNDDDGLEGIECLNVLKHHDKDVYSVEFHPRGNAIACGGYDRSIRLYDVETGNVLKRFDGHRGAISSVTFNARGNMIVSGSKDNTIKFWDVISGLCVRTISSHLGEVTSVETNHADTILLSSSKDNSNRLWDMRMTRALCRFKGHQNTSKNFVRCAFGPKESVVVGGSEDGLVYIWDVATTDVMRKLGAAGGAVYVATWNARQGLLASCSHDGVVSTWCYDENVPGG